jgi:hypothetical protein
VTQFKVVPEGPPIIGKGQRWVAIATAEDSTTPDMFEVVMTHCWSDNALSVLLGNIRVVIREELDARGVGGSQMRRRKKR